MLAAAGVDVYSIFAKSGLPSVAIERDNIRISSSRAYDALHRAGRNQGIENIGFHAAAIEHFQKCKKSLRRRLDESLSVHQVLRRYRDIVHVVNPTRRAAIQLNGELASFAVFADTDDTSAVWLNHSDWGHVWNVIALVRRGVGPEFLPNRVELMSDWPLPQGFDDYLDCSVMRCRPAVKVWFPKKLLLTPYPSAARERHDRPTLEDRQRTEASLPTVVAETLRGYLTEGALDIDSAAQIFGTSPRTLQRQLLKHGTTFSEIVLQERMRLALKLLTDPSASLADIAAALGYAEQSSFNRAFRTTVGVTPGAYRRLRLSTPY